VEEDDVSDKNVSVKEDDASDMNVSGRSRDHSEDDVHEYKESAAAVLSKNDAIYINCSMPEANNRREGDANVAGEEDQSIAVRM
jgi:hypothetical protein